MPADALIAARRDELWTWYSEAVFRYRLFERAFADHLARALRNAYLDDAKLESRTKTVESLIEKALTSDGRGGFKYADPRRGITDFVGARILVPLSTDVAPVAQLIGDTYEVVEMSTRRPHDDDDVPGYQSLHFLVRLTEHDQSDEAFRDFDPVVVEVQVRTILQHAWAALQHDLMYKAERASTPVVRRRLTALAGLLELADREFVSVRQTHGPNAQPDHVGLVETGAADHGPIELRALVEEVFAEPDPAGDTWYDALGVVISELGLADLEEARTVLGPWLDRAPSVADAVRATQPWATSGYLFDVLLRLALDEGYLVARAAASGREITETMREEYVAERAEILGRVGS